MARNQEKAMSMLNRWVRMKQELDKNPEQDRPSDPHVCKNVKSCIFWREDLINEIMRKVTEIQNAALGEHRIRELNDEINDFLQEKREWEARILELGGPDFKAQEADIINAEASELPGVDDYKYFGAAKDLPRVREKLQRAVPTVPKRNFKQLHQQIYLEYFGEEQNEALERIEQEWEQRHLQEYVSEGITQNAEVKVLPYISDAFEESRLFKAEDEADETEDGFLAELFRATRSSEPQKAEEEEDIDVDQIQKMIIEKKKQLLEKEYTAVEEKPQDLGIQIE